MIRVLIADDTKILCNRINVILNNDNEIEVLGRVYDGREAIEVCDSLKPDVVLIDMRMPKYNGAYAIKIIKEKYQNTKVLVLTTFDDSDTIKCALLSGADGYILKEYEGEKIISAIKSVYYGIIVFGESIFHQIKKDMKESKQYAFDDFNITEREYILLSYIVNGYNNKEIAFKMNLSDGTIRNNISKLLEKLKLKDRTQLAVYAVKHGIG